MSGPTGDVHDNGDFNFRSFFMDIPPVTRTLFITLFTFTLLPSLNVLPINLFILSWPDIITKFQIWRLIFTFFHIGRGGINFLIRMYFLFTYSKQLEIGTFFGRPANYAWFLSIVSGVVLLLSTVISSPINGGSLLLAIIHLWGRHANNVSVSMYGFIQIPAKYLSLTMLALDVILSGGVAAADVFGVLGGHLYYFLDTVYPSMPEGKMLIAVPLWFERFIDQVQAFLGSVTGLHSGPPPPSNYRSSTAGSQSTSRIGGISSGFGNRDATSSGARGGITSPTSRGGSHVWGTGHALGS